MVSGTGSIFSRLGRHTYLKEKGSKKPSVHSPFNGGGDGVDPLPPIQMILGTIITIIARMVQSAESAWDFPVIATYIKKCLLQATYSISLIKLVFL